MADSTSSYDVLLVGGGVIGLSLAWELSQHGAKVCIVDKGLMGQEASWAGAGMIPAGPNRDFWNDSTPLEKLAGMSEQLHAQWHQKLKEQTGIDNGYLPSGALYVAENEVDSKSLEQKVARWQQLGIQHQKLDAAQLAELEPAIAEQADRFSAIYLVPGESQLRNPRHAQAIVAACEQQGVELFEGVAVHDIGFADDKVVSVLTDKGTIQAKQFCLSAGCWTGPIASRLGLEVSIKPIRGQIVLLDGSAGLLRRHVNVGKRYLVPRAEGRILVGSTMEDVGYLKQNTASATAELLDFANSLMPASAEMPIETSWSGLRPATENGLPIMGRIPGLENGWIAAGHFRAGLQLSTATAVVMRQLMMGEAADVDIELLGAER